MVPVLVQEPRSLIDEGSIGGGTDRERRAGEFPFGFEIHEHRAAGGHGLGIGVGVPGGAVALKIDGEGLIGGVELDLGLIAGGHGEVARITEETEQLAAGAIGALGRFEFGNGIETEDGDDGHDHKHNEQFNRAESATRVFPSRKDRRMDVSSGVHRQKDPGRLWSLTPISSERRRGWFRRMSIGRAGRAFSADSEGIFWDSNFGYDGGLCQIFRPSFRTRPSIPRPACRC